MGLTPSEIAAFHAGVRHAAEMALIAALTIELRPDADQIRQRAAVEALRGLADGLKGSLPSSPETVDNVHGIERPSGHGPELDHPRSPPASNRETALAAGFTGDACPNCGSFAMKRTGTCLTCQACGSTTGCSQNG